MFVNVSSNSLFMHISLKERLLLMRHILRATFAISRNFNFVPSEEIRRITNDIHVQTNFSGELSDIATFIFMPKTK